MKYTDTTSAYNERRYGKPWMAITTDSLTRDFRFVDWDGRPGGVGEFRFECAPGAILARGQKDLRKNRGGVDGYELAMPDGTLAGLTDSEALALRKLPIAERPEACARINIAEAEAAIARYSAQPPTDYTAQQIARQAAKIAKFSAFLPATAEPDAEDFLCGAA